MDALLHVLESGEILVLEYAGPNWFRNLVTSGDNKEAFEEIYDDLRDIMKYLFGIEIYYYPLSDATTLDQEEMARKLTTMKGQELMTLFGTSTANFERSSELHIQSYSLEIALEKLNKDVLPKFGEWNVTHLSKGCTASSHHGQRSISFHPDIRIERHTHKVGKKVRELAAFCDSFRYRRRTGKHEVGDDLKVEATTYETVSLTVPTDDLRVEPSTIKLGTVLGTGTYSEVRAAEWVDCEFAVKILKASDVRALRREVGIHMKLRHPHVVQLVGFSADEEQCMILMELMESDLHTHVASQMEGDSQNPPFSLVEAVDLMKQIAAGMQFLHYKNIVHGDLKTRNVLLMRKRDRVQLKITDFGVSQEKLVKAREGVYKSSSFSEKVGSGWYRAPEILESTILRTEANYSGKADVYSFAMTAYEILTGLAPFENKATTRQGVVDGDRPELPPQLSSTLKQLVERCWHGQQDVRPSFKEICAELKSLKLSLEVRGHAQRGGVR